MARKNKNIEFSNTEESTPEMVEINDAPETLESIEQEAPVIEEVAPEVIDTPVQEEPAQATEPKAEPKAEPKPVAKKEAAPAPEEKPQVVAKRVMVRG